jgi:hypothetical protein
MKTIIKYNPNVPNLRQAYDYWQDQPGNYDQMKAT